MYVTACLGYGYSLSLSGSSAATATVQLDVVTLLGNLTWT